MLQAPKVTHDTLDVQNVAEGHGEKQPATMIHPDSRFKRKWDHTLAFMIIYSTLSVPWRLGFSVPATDTWHLFESLIDMFFAMDILVQFRTGFALNDYSNEFVWDPHQIARRCGTL